MAQCDTFGQCYPQITGNPSCPCLSLAVVNEIQQGMENVWIGGTNYSFGDGGIYPRPESCGVGASD